MMIEGECVALVLRMLSQILIKLHAGPAWGESEEGVRRMIDEAYQFANKMREAEVEVPLTEAGK